MKILQTRDKSFDTYRAFLVTSMIFTHTFNCFVLNDYNRHLTYYVTIGFVFISGFTYSAIYSERIILEPYKYILKLSVRAFKLLLLFLFCNIPLFFAKYQIFSQLTVQSFFSTLFLSNNQTLFAFDALIPISLTIFICGFLNIKEDISADFLLTTVFLFLIYIFESKNILNYYGIKLLLVWLTGCTTGKLVKYLDWEQTRKFLSGRLSLTILGFITFIYFSIFFFYREIPRLLSYHLIPTVIMILFVYIFSYTFRVYENRIINFLNNSLSNHLVFAYLFHIVLNVLLLQIIKGDSIDLINTVLLSLFILLVTVAVCHSITVVTRKSSVAARAYTFVFK